MMEMRSVRSATQADSTCKAKGHRGRVITVESAWSQARRHCERIEGCRRKAYIVDTQCAQKYAHVHVNALRMVQRLGWKELHLTEDRALVGGELLGRLRDAHFELADAARLRVEQTTSVCERFSHGNQPKAFSERTKRAVRVNASTIWLLCLSSEADTGDEWKLIRSTSRNANERQVRRNVQCRWRALPQTSARSAAVSSRPLGS